jgi:hypothetical protein
MSKRIKTDKELADAIGALPAAVEPERDLWPGISARLGAVSGTESARQGGWRHQALAASVAVAFVAGLMFGRQMGESELEPAGPAGMQTAMLAAMQASEREYQAAFREFIPVGSANTLLSSQTIENIESSWAEMQQAESALQIALSEYPENTYLNQKLLDLRAQQLDFMKQLATLDQFSRRKI